MTIMRKRRQIMRKFLTSYRECNSFMTCLTFCCHSWTGISSFNAVFSNFFSPKLSNQALNRTRKRESTRSHQPKPGEPWVCQRSLTSFPLARNPCSLLALSLLIDISEDYFSHKTVNRPFRFILYINQFQRCPSHPPPPPPGQPRGISLRCQSQGVAHSQFYRSLGTGH